ncbi:unnamed protein product [Psylliodes chrysocephalus]|uniref:Uncharacterized protein n=1 Tax=Psylliodes chrysocephalus TaxID=3402493 RepID=A0A9P0CGX7_9CUCU|nr:unnamed protein product [Psylliodes chrysocephala]
MDVSAWSSICMSPVNPARARKRIKQPLKWKRNVAKRLKYSAKSLPTFPECGHKSKAFMCATLKMKDLFKFHKKFHENLTKTSQDNFILKYMSLVPIKRRRHKNGNGGGKREMQTKFTIRGSDYRCVPVCQKTFLNVLHVTRARVSYIAKQFATNGNNACEKRGGDRKAKLFYDKKQAVIKFICSLQCVESHYCRGKSVRKYLSSNLSTNKFFSIYNSQAADEVKRSKSAHNQVLISGEKFYRSEYGIFRTLTKKAFNIRNINPDRIHPDNLSNVSREKLKDVKKLLATHYGQGWRDDPSLNYYNEVLARGAYPTVPCEEEEFCEPGQEEEVPLRV